MRKLVTLFLIILITGCALPRFITGNIESFNFMDNYEGSILYISPADKENINSLQWKSIKNKFSQKFIEAGYKVTDDLNESDLSVFIGYQISTKAKIGSSDIWGQTGISSSSSSLLGDTLETTYMPSYGVVGSRSYEYDENTRLVLLDIYDIKASKKDLKKVYELTLSSKGSCNILTEVIDEFIEAIFNDFPNNNGRFTQSGSFDC